MKKETLNNPSIGVKTGGNQTKFFIMMLESLNASKFKALTPENLKFIKGGELREEQSSWPQGERIYIFGGQYDMYADKATWDTDKGEYVCFEYMDRSGVWHTLR